MQSVRYRFSIPNYVAARADQRLGAPRLRSGRIPGLEQVELPSPALPGPDWLRLRPRLSGICGSDLALLLGRSGPALSPFTSFPAVLGHEVVAEVTETGSGANGVRVGDRVVVDPVITCEMRGLEPCPSCARGEPGLCTEAAEGSLAPGMLIGFCRDLPGGWAEEMVAHRSQIHPVPASLSDESAVLIEPLSVALHAVLKHPPEPTSRILIVGGGTIGLLVLAALRLLDHRATATILVRHPVQGTMAEKLGAERIFPGDAGDAAVTVAGARCYRPVAGRPVYAGGFAWVYDCVGSARSLDDSLRVAGPHGRVILVGCAGQLPRVDCTFIWARELQVSGSYVYGREGSLADAPHTFELALRLLAERPDYPLRDLVTHRFPLVRWREAMAASFRRGSCGAIKVTFDHRPDGGLRPEGPPVASGEE